MPYAGFWLSMRADPDIVSHLTSTMILGHWLTLIISQFERSNLPQSCWARQELETGRRLWVPLSCVNDTLQRMLLLCWTNFLFRILEMYWVPLLRNHDLAQTSALPLRIIDLGFRFWALLLLHQIAMRLYQQPPVSQACRPPKVTLIIVATWGKGGRLR